MLLLLVSDGSKYSKVTSHDVYKMIKWYLTVFSVQPRHFYFKHLKNFFYKKTEYSENIKKLCFYYVNLIKMLIEHIFVSWAFWRTATA